MHDRNDNEESSTAMIPTTASDLHAEEETPLSSVLSAARSPPNAGGHVAWTVQHQPDGHRPDEIGSAERTAPKSAPSSGHEFAEDVAQMNAPASAHVSAEDAAEMSAPASAPGSAGDVAEMIAPAPEHRPIEDIATESDTEMPVAYENTSV